MFVFWCFHMFVLKFNVFSILKWVITLVSVYLLCQEGKQQLCLSLNVSWNTRLPPQRAPVSGRCVLVLWMLLATCRPGCGGHAVWWAWRRLWLWSTSLWSGAPRRWRSATCSGNTHIWIRSSWLCQGKLSRRGPGKSFNSQVMCLSPGWWTRVMSRMWTLTRIFLMRWSLRGKTLSSSESRSEIHQLPILIDTDQ